jgi:hypothetical protein
VYLDSVIGGIPILSPVTCWFCRGISNPGKGLHVLQAKFYGHQEAEGCSMFYREGLTAVPAIKDSLILAGV